MRNKPKMSSVFLNGIITENPTFRLVLGTCPTIAVTSSLINAVGMGAAASFVLIGSNLVISLLRNFIPDKVRIPCFIVVICTFVTLVQMLLQAFIPSLYASLGMFIPLIVVNCIILARAEAFASKNGPLASVVDGLGMGLGFTLAISIIAIVRELLGTGCIAGINVTANKYLATCIGAGISGLGGLYYVMDYTKGTWANDGTIESLGWLAVALVIFSTWKPIRTVWGSYLFGLFYWIFLYIGLSRRTQEIFRMLPYVVTILVLIIVSLRKRKEDQPPEGLGQAYFREER